jgi:hypothetical protein
LDERQRGRRYVHGNSHITNEDAGGGVTNPIVRKLIVKTYVLTCGHGELTTFKWLTGLPRA